MHKSIHFTQIIVLNLLTWMFAASLYKKSFNGALIQLFLYISALIPGDKQWDAIAGFDWIKVVMIE